MPARMGAMTQIVSPIDGTFIAEVPDFDAAAVAAAMHRAGISAIRAAHVMLR